MQYLNRTKKKKEAILSAEAYAEKSSCFTRTCILTADAAEHVDSTEASVDKF